MNKSKGCRSTKNFEAYIKKWNDILSLMGVCPVSWYIKDSGDVAYRVSPWRMTISVMVILLSILVVCVQVADKKFDLVNIGSTVISGYLNITGNIVTCLNMVSGLLNARVYAALSTSFLEFNKNSLNARVSPILNMSAKFISFYAVIFCFSFCIDYTILDDDEDILSFKFLLNYIFVMYNILCVCHFAVCCFWIREYLLDINREIEKHSTYVNIRPFHVTRTRTDFIKFGVVHPETTPETEPTARTDSSVIKMKFIRRLYHQVYVLSLRVNQIFSTRNLVSVANNFILGTILVYCGLSEVVKYVNNKSKLSIMEILNFFKWSGISFLSIYGLVWPSTKVYSEAQTTSMLIQEYFTKSPKGGLQSEIHSFVMQLFHEKISFSPHGFFSLNNELLLSIIGSVASYIVIMIQFRITVV